MGMDGEVSLGGESKLPTVKLPGDMGIAPPYMSSPTFAMLMPLLVVRRLVCVPVEAVEGATSWVELLARLSCGGWREGDNVA